MGRTEATPRHGSRELDVASLRCCQACGEPLVKRARESYQQFTVRRSCSKGCATSLRYLPAVAVGLPPLEAAFLRLVERITVESPGCWIVGKNRNNYAAISVRGQGKKTAHRLVYEHLVGPIPKGRQLDHLCRVPACVNPDHLEPVTPAENKRRGYSFAARRARQNRCSRGHDLTGDNLLIERHGERTSRRCRPCRRLNETWRRQQGVAA